MTRPGGPGAAIVGTGFSDVARHSSASLGAHVIQACLRAIEDCGLTVADIILASDAAERPIHRSDRR